MATKMIKKMLPLILLIFTVACSVKQPQQKAVAPAIASDADSTKYELIVLDPGFESWYALKNSPAQMRSLEYYKNWNRQYVTEWNLKSGMARYASFFSEPINYDYREEYPMEIEHKLFHYFQFVEKEMRIPILPRGFGPRP